MLKLYFIKFVMCVCAAREGARVYAGVGGFISVCMLLQINVYFLPYFLLGHAVGGG